MRKSGLYILALLPAVLAMVVAFIWFNSLQKEMAAEFEVGIRGFKVTPKKGKMALPINLVSDPVCSFGDLDLFKMESQISRKKSLLLTVEPLEGRGATIVKNVTLNEFDSGKPLVVDLAATSAPQVLGIYLCTSGRSDRRCSDKKEISTGSRMKAYFSGNYSERERMLASDKILYMQPILVLGDKIKFPALAMMPDHMYDLLERYFEAKAGLKANTAYALVDRVKRLDRETRKTPAFYDKQLGRFTLTFTKFDQRRCKK